MISSADPFFSSRSSMRVSISVIAMHATASRVPPSTETSVVVDLVWSVSNLGRDHAFFVHFAVAALRQEAGLGVRDDPHRARCHDPRLNQHLGVLDRDLVLDRVALARELLDHMHLV